MHAIAFTGILNIKELKMTKEIISTDKAPQAIGTYSQAVKVGDTVYMSGQIPLIPENMEMVEGDIKLQIHRVFQNLQAVANAAGGDLSNIVKLNIFLTDLSDFPHVNEVMAEYFQQPYPARAAIGVSALPKDAGVEMDAVLQL
jgi:reactive intermediate/imine deaminase